MSRRFQFSFEPPIEFTLDNFRRVMIQVAKLGPLNRILKLLPGLDTLADAVRDEDNEGYLRRLNGIIDSMTVKERHNPSRLIEGERLRRIAAGAGVDPAEVSTVVRQFEGMADAIRRRTRPGFDP
jgi:signal recognition particle subunit SRP54